MVVYDNPEKAFPAASNNRKQSLEMDEYYIRPTSKHGEQMPSCSCGVLLDDIPGHIHFHRRLGHSVTNEYAAVDAGPILEDPRGMSI